MDQEHYDESGGLQRLLSMMQRLLQTPDGLELYRRIEHGSQACEDMTARLENRFLAFISDELQQYLEREDPEPSTRMVARLILRRLLPYLEDETASPEDDSTDAINKLQLSMAEVLEQAGQMESWRKATEAIEGELRANNARFNLAADSDDVLDMESRKQELISHFEGMQNAFDQSRIGNKDFLNNLKTIRMALSPASATRDVEEWKPLLLEAIDEIIDWQEGLMNQLLETAGFLEQVKVCNSSLHEEILKVRKLTQTDEFTGLPNQDAFLRRLYGEMQRARRFRQPLTICLLGLDLTVADGLDSQAAEAVVIYADDVISQFRGYDMVARTDVLQFGILLPGTDIEGASIALTEAQHRAAGRQLADNGKISALPSFHCGVASMHPNDTADELLARAEEAYLRAAAAGPQTLEAISGDIARGAAERK